MKSWTVGKRIVFGFSALIAISAAVGLVAHLHLSSIRSDSEKITGDCLPGVYLIGQIESLNLSNYLNLHRLVMVTDAAGRDAISARMKETSARMTEIYDQYAKTITTDEDRKLYAAVETARTKYADARKKFMADLDKLSPDQGFARLQADVDPAYQSYYSTIRALVDFNKKSGDTAGAAITASVGSARRGIVIGLGAALLIGAATATIIIRGTNRSLRSVVEVLDTGSAAIASASAQVASAGQQLAEGATEEAASLEETSASLEELSSMTKRNAENATAAKALATQTRAAADHGAADVQDMSRAMDGIKASADNIAQIIKTIDEIAFQTNILALNAAVEAARAGDAGLGFAVVADEVRNLAQRSATAARETADKIEDSITKSVSGVAISTKVAAEFSEIVEKARQVDELVGHIAVASQEQSQGIGQITTAVSQMDTVTQRTAAHAEESAAAAQELSAQAISLDRAVRDIRTLVGGASRRASNAVAATRKTKSPVATPADAKHNAAPRSARVPEPALF